MFDSQSLCMNCMKKLDGSTDICPRCKLPVRVEQNLPYLPAGTVLADRYIVGRVIEEYGEGVTYIGYDNLSNKVVNIREFLPVSIIKRSGSDLAIRVKIGAEDAYRSCYQSFVRLWRSLMRYAQQLACLPRVTDVLTNVNLTAYAVFDSVGGTPLASYVKSLGLPGDVVSLEKANELLVPLMPTVKALNDSGFYHLSISNMSIYVMPDGRPCIMRFSIPEVCRSQSPIGPLLSPGFAALEQFTADSKLGSYTDNYSFASVFLWLLTGIVPPNSPERVTNDRLLIQQDVAATLPRQFVHVLFHSLRVLPQDRLSSIDDFVNLFFVKPAITPNEQSDNTAISSDTEESAPNSDNEPSESIDAQPDFIDEHQEPDAQKKEKKSKKNKKEKKDEKAKAAEANDDSPVDSGVKQKNGSGVAKAGIISFICSFLLSVVIFTALYSTFLFNYIDIPVLDSLCEYIPMLPINEEPTFVELNDVIGMDYDDAYNTLVAAGFVVVKDTLDNTDGMPVNQVKSMFPHGGTECAYGEKITLTVWGELIVPEETSGSTDNIEFGDATTAQEPSDSLADEEYSDEAASDVTEDSTIDSTDLSVIAN